MSRGREHHKRNVAYCDLLRSSSPMPIPASDMRWTGSLGKNLTRHFGIKSPLTNQWIDFEVDERVFHAHIPAIKSGPAIDHYNDMIRVVDVARGMEIYKDELKAYDENEARIFGAVRSALPIRGKSRFFSMYD